MQIERLHASKEWYTCQVVCQRNDIVNLAPLDRCIIIIFMRLCDEKFFLWITTITKYFHRSIFFFNKNNLILYDIIFWLTYILLLLFLLLFFLTFVKNFLFSANFFLSPPFQTRGTRYFIIIFRKNEETNCFATLHVYVYYK